MTGVSVYVKMGKGYPVPDLDVEAGVAKPGTPDTLPDASLKYL